MSYDCIVIGGGAAGIMAACTAGNQGKSVLILEVNETVGKKILATGNGRCNFTNDYMGIECFRTDTDFQKMESVLNRFTKDDTLSFFEEIGIYGKIRFGTGYYPLSMQASQVRDALVLALKKRQISIVYNFKCIKIEKTDFGYRAISTDGKKYSGKTCIVTTGGYASPKTGSDGALYYYLKKNGIKTADVVPALVPLKCTETFFKSLQGVRWEANVSVSHNNNVISNQGELQFTKEGISGIPVFQISRFIAKDLLTQKKCTVQIDLYPDFSKEVLKEQFEKRFYDEGWYKTSHEALIGIMNDKLIDVLLELSGIDKTESASSISESQLKSLLRLCKNFSITVCGTKGFEFAQTTAGGIDLTAVSDDLESLDHEGLYFAGEILDVDGICGGYNLQWAWASGYVAGLAASFERE